MAQMGAMAILVMSSPRCSDRGEGLGRLFPKTSDVKRKWVHNASRVLGTPEINKQPKSAFIRG